MSFIPIVIRALAFAVRMLGADYAIAWPDFAIRSDDQRAFALDSYPAQILLLRYLLEGRMSRGSGAFLAFRELPWGEVYHKAFEGRCLARAARAFGPDLKRFIAAAGQLPSHRLPRADAAFQFEFMPGYELQLFLWEGDDEFPPSCQILFSDNFPMAFTAEDRTAVGDILIAELKRRMARV